MTKLVGISQLVRPLDRKEYWLKKFRDEAAINSETMSPQEFQKWKEKEMIKESERRENEKQSTNSK
jgi:hypothetical protein